MNMRMSSVVFLLSLSVLAIWSTDACQTASSETVFAVWVVQVIDDALCSRPALPDVLMMHSTHSITLRRSKPGSGISRAHRLYDGNVDECLQHCGDPSLPQLPEMEIPCLFHQGGDACDPLTILEVHVSHPLTLTLSLLEV